MSAPSALAGLRIGAVSYLNTKPLIWPLPVDAITLDVPARSADSFYQGDLDVALLPLFEVLHHGGGPVADNVAIACEGLVFSVLVGSRTEFADCGEIYLDPSSRTSVALLRVLIGEYYPHLHVRGGEPPEGAARLLIGDPAITFHRNLQDGWQCHDLGALWQHHTGLPFVFAVWALKKGLPNESDVAEALRTCKDQGLAKRDQIANGEKDPDFAREYLTRFIRYEIGPREREAIGLFSKLAARHGLLVEPPNVTFV